ncbi:UNVERIFIED_CONTAM: DNA polymerase-3 subunit epsilon [Brevibacillus sp. OAP136]
MSLWNRLFSDLRLPYSLSSSVTGNDPGQLAFLRAMKKDLQQDRVLESPLESLEVVVVDLETTGFFPQKGDEIISIGAVAMRGTTILEAERFETLVNPQRTVPPEIEALTGIRTEDLRDAPALLAALSRFFSFVAGRTLVAHHSRHERDFLQAGLWKTSRSKLTHRLLDTTLLFRLEDRTLENASLEALCERHNLPIEKRHDAYHDALAAAKLWSIYLERAMAKGFRDLLMIYEYIGRRL